MLIACFPTAALILIKKYIWVRIWIAKCDLRPLDFAQTCPQNAGNVISENQISKNFRGDMPPNPPRNTSSLWPNILGAPNLSWPPQLNRSQHATESIVKFLIVLNKDQRANRGFKIYDAAFKTKEFLHTKQNTLRVFSKPSSFCKQRHSKHFGTSSERRELAERYESCSLTLTSAQTLWSTIVSAELVRLGWNIKSVNIKAWNIKSVVFLYKSA